MKALLTLSLISFLVLAGCSKGIETQDESSLVPNQSLEISTETTVNVIKSSEEPNEPKSYQVNVGEGIGIKEGS